MFTISRSTGRRDTIITRGFVTRRSPEGRKRPYDETDLTGKDDGSGVLSLVNRGKDFSEKTGLEEDITNTEEIDGCIQKKIET